MRYLKHLLKFDSRHLKLVREMIFERLTWDEEIEEDRIFLEAIETIISERKPDGVSSAREAKELKWMINDLVVKTLDGSLAEEDIPQDTEYSAGTIGLLISEQLGAIIASEKDDKEATEERLRSIVASLESVDAPPCWMLLTISCIAKDHRISFTRFQHMPEFQILARKYRKSLRATV